MTIGKFLDITQSIRNKDNSLFLVTLTGKYVAVHACNIKSNDIILKCEYDRVPLSVKSIGRIIFKNINNCKNIYISFRYSFYDISKIVVVARGTYVLTKPFNTDYYDSAIFT